MNKVTIELEYYWSKKHKKARSAGCAFRIGPLDRRLTRSTSSANWHGRRWLDQPPDYFFHKGAQTFLEYLQATRIGFKPPSDLSEPFDPGGLHPHDLAWEPPGPPFTPPM